MEISTSSSYSIFNILESFKTNITYEIYIPNNILHRTELMCMYIQEEVDTRFCINNFIMLLYEDFINYSVKNYNPKRVLKEALRKDSIGEEDSLTLVMDNKTYIINKKATEYTSVYVKMSKREAKKGQLILDELYDLYKHKIPFEVLLSNLWINFIEDYKSGTNKRAYTSIVKILKG